MRKWKCWCCAHTNTLQHYSLVQYLYISACCVETIIIILLFSMYIATCTYVYFHTPCEECSSFCERQSLAQYTYRDRVWADRKRWDERGRTFYNFFGLHGRVKHNYLRYIGWKWVVLPVREWGSLGEVREWDLLGEVRECAHQMSCLGRCEGWQVERVTMWECVVWSGETILKLQSAPLQR